MDLLDFKKGDKVEMIAYDYAIFTAELIQVETNKVIVKNIEVLSKCYEKSSLITTDGLEFHKEEICEIKKI